MIGNIVELSHMYMKQFAGSGSVIIDATCGNGNDTLFLSELAGESGTVHAFDIQALAVANTKKRLKGGADNVVLYHASHADMNKYVKGEIDLCVFNLGYLPGSDKTVATSAAGTITALISALNLLKTYGACILALYLGHPGGFDEYKQVSSFIRNLNKKRYNVIEIYYPALYKTAPRLTVIEKINGGDNE